MNKNFVLNQAGWIGANFVSSPRNSAPAPYFRKSFHLACPVKSALLTITALGLYECEINGRKVGDEIFAPGWTDYTRRVQYQCHDVAELLSEGENAIGIVLGDGWYCGFVGWGTRQVYGDRPRVLAQLDLVMEDGSSRTIATDSTWKTSPGPIIEDDLIMGETYDARLELTGYSEPGYDEREWNAVRISPPNTLPELCPRLGPAVRRIQEIAPLSVNVLEIYSKQYRIHDMGQNFAGRARIKVRAKRGTLVRILYSEMLLPDGRIYTENLRDARAADYYICKGEGEEIWEPRFTFHGFRYVEVSGLSPEEPVEVTGIVLGSDTRPIGTFRCSNPMLNQLQSNITWGQKSNFLEVPTDCPQRNERLGWTGDAQVFVRTAAFNMDVKDFFHKWMRDVRDAQTEKGGIPSVVPNKNFLGLPADEDGGPAWADAAVICPWTIYLCYNDVAILEENYETMRRFMEFIAASRCVGRIRSHPAVDPWGGYGDWLALDGTKEWDGLTSKDLIGTAFYAYDAAIMSQVAAWLGRDTDAVAYQLLHGEIVEAFCNRFVTPDGLVMPGTQTAYVLALHFDLLPEGMRAAAAAELVRLIEKQKWHLATGFVGTPYLLEVLEANGYLDVAYRLLEQETFPSWLFPVLNGATTIWERWDGWTPTKGFQDKAMNSFNHYAYGAVGAWMYRSVAGLELDPAEPGYRRIIFRPRPGGSLTWAEAKLETPSGPASIRWELTECGLRLEIEVPPQCHAVLEPPGEYRADFTRYDAGKHEIFLKSSAEKSPQP
jgi:alpha-L-rhamnosidase